MILSTPPISALINLVRIGVLNNHMMQYLALNHLVIVQIVISFTVFTRTANVLKKRNQSVLPLLVFPLSITICAMILKLTSLSP